MMIEHEVTSWTDNREQLLKKQNWNGQLQNHIALVKIVDEDRMKNTSKHHEHQKEKLW